MNGYFQQQIGHLMRPKPNLVAALVLFLIYITALCQLVIYPAQFDLDLNHLDLFIKGALLGLAAYGTYDLTCLAAFKGYSLNVAVIDMLWGTFLTGTVTVLTVKFAKHMAWLGYSA